jgi:hypothetical protein
MPVRTLIIVLLSVAALAGCGRRGSLEEPGTPATGTIAAPPGSGISPLDPGSPPVAAPPQSVSQPAPERRFLLDFLL